MAQQQTFTTSNGRRWISVPDPGGGKNIGLYYEATEAEVNRVKNKTYTDNGRQISGEPYTAVVDGKNYVLHSSYSFESNRYVYRPYPPAEEIENGNYQQYLEIERNTALKEQITSGVTTGPGGTTPTTGPGGTTPTTAPTPNEQGGSTPITQPTTGTEPTDTMLYYPEDIASNKQDRIMFQAHTYESGTRLSGTIFDFELSPVKYTPFGPAVFLPIQSPIIDQNSVGWESDTLNPIEIAAAKYSNNLITSETKDIGTVAAGGIGGALNLIKNDPRLQETIKNYIIGQAIGVNNLVSRLQGQVLNPNLELLFTGPQLRPFNFTFKMSARSRDEAKTIKKIIKYFKQNMATKKDPDGLFLRAPNVFKIQYQYGKDKEVHKSLNLIKMCALTNCSVDYTPLGTYMTYSDGEGTMIAYTMSLSFQELTPIYNTDYDNFAYGEGETVKTHPIGP